MTEMAYKKDGTRVASSTLTTELLGDVTRYQMLLQKEQKKLLEQYTDNSILDSIFSLLDTRIINLCPMVLCDRFLHDRDKHGTDPLLAGLGLSMFSISTHDDVVDELPQNRLDVAGLVYGGNIATLEGLKILYEARLGHVASEVITYINMNHYYQTKIVTSLWSHPCNKNEYLAAINHTKYWAEIDMRAAIVFSQDWHFANFVEIFARYYGLTCQIFDDMREIDDDVKNGYWSLPISLAQVHGWDISTNEGKRLSIEEPRKLAEEYLNQARALCGNRFPALLDLVERISAAGSRINY